MKFFFEYGDDPGESIITCEDLFIGRTEPLFYIREVELHRGERVGIIGENGAGKSTFLKTILKKLPVLEGTLKYGK